MVLRTTLLVKPKSVRRLRRCIRMEAANSAVVFWEENRDHSAREIYEALGMTRGRFEAAVGRARA